MSAAASASAASSSSTIAAKPSQVNTKRGSCHIRDETEGKVKVVATKFQGTEYYHVRVLGCYITQTGRQITEACYFVGSSRLKFKIIGDFVRIRERCLVTDPDNVNADRKKVNFNYYVDIAKVQSRTYLNLYNYLPLLKPQEYYLGILKRIKATHPTVTPLCVVFNRHGAFVQCEVQQYLWVCPKAGQVTKIDMNLTRRRIDVATSFGPRCYMDLNTLCSKDLFLTYKWTDQTNLDYPLLNDEPVREIPLEQIIYEEEPNSAAAAAASSDTSLAMSDVDLLLDMAKF